MIVTRLRGGLGNQLFQFATGRRLSQRHGTSLKLDLGPLERSVDRHYNLHAFRITADPATPKDIRSCCSPSRIVCVMRRLLGKPTGPVQGQESGFDPTTLDLPDGVCLDGYWQSERYFSDAETVIRRELRYVSPPTGKNYHLAAEMAESNSVSLHVRRGDYVAHPEARRILGICGVDYYRRAIRHISATVNSPRYYVFSDDPEWARLNLHIDAPVTLIDHNGSARPHEDLRLMSLCRHHVIANSTFSWWAAWLAEGDGRTTGVDRLIIAPERWYRSEEHRSDDLVPERWTRL